jgi:GT2 family glycosyltransferase/glycosyltransferase involved in cell wall biosynthesis
VLDIRGLVAWPRRLFVSAMLRLGRVSSEIERRLTKRLSDRSDRSVIGRSGLFDIEWYLAQNPDVAAAGINPLVQYLHRGASEGRDPNPLFDTDWYLAQNPDVAAAGINPLLHYLRHGAAEGRDPNPLFDTDWYLAQNPDVAAAGINPLAHYLQSRMVRAATEFPEGLSFFRFARRHRLGYVIKTGEHPDGASSHVAGLRAIRSEELQPTCRRGAEPLDNRRVDIIVPASRGFDRRHGDRIRIMVLLNHAFIDLIDLPRRALGVLFTKGPRAFLRKTLEALRERLASLKLGVRAMPELPGDLSLFRLGRWHRLEYVAKTDERLAESSSPSTVRPIQLKELLPSYRRGAKAPDDRRVDVIVPIYRGFDETRRCVESVLAGRPSNCAFGRLVLIDDCGPEPELRRYLSDVARQDAVVLLNNPANLGFVASVNRGMAYAGSNDVILLNSDTEVSGNWVDRLVIQAHADSRIGTVTPLSNNATICSYPDLGGQSTLPPGTTARDMDSACAEANALRAVQIPTGVGSCMYIKRACLDDVGAFDEGTFAKGYGEETDFCQRASLRGWVHLLAGDVFVFHLGETSFGDSSEEGKAKALAIMRERYPAYEQSVARWIGLDPALSLRLAATAALWRLSKRPVVLHVLHSWGGGTEKHVAELAARLVPSALQLVLVAKRSAQHVRFLLLISEPPDWRAVEFASATMCDVAPFLSSFGLTQVHVHHFVDVFDQIVPFLRQLALPYDLSIHDYTVICPRINLVKDDAIYCGEPDEKGCLRCLLKGRGLGDDILWWRHLGISMIRGADRVLCPSIDAAKRIRKYVPDSRIIIVPHEDELYRPKRAVRLSPLRPGDPLRVAVLGTLSELKGGSFLLDCVEAASESGTPIAWYVVGEFSSSLKARAKQLKRFISVTGRYRVDDVPRLIDDVGPHVLLFVQRWPETYSFTLSEAFQAGYPILAPDIGAFSERVSGLLNCGLYSLETTPHELVAKLASIHRHYLELGRPFDDEGGHWTAPTGIGIETRFYLDQYPRRSRGDVVHPRNEELSGV